MRIPIILISIFLISCVSDSGDTNVQVGSYLYDKGNYDSAKTQLQKAINKDLFAYTKQDAYTILGNVFSELGQHDSSIFYHSKAIELDSNYVSAWINMGLSYRYLSNLKTAEHCYLKALEINPESAEAYANLGSLQIIRDDAKSAISYLEKSLEFDSDISTTHANYSLALAMIGNYARSLKVLETSISLGFPDSVILRNRIEELKMVKN